MSAQTPSTLNPDSNNYDIYEEEGELGRLKGNSDTASLTDTSDDEEDDASRYQSFQSSELSSIEDDYDLLIVHRHVESLDLGGGLKDGYPLFKHVDSFELYGIKRDEDDSSANLLSENNHATPIIDSPTIESFELNVRRDDGSSVAGGETTDDDDTSSAVNKNTGIKWQCDFCKKAQFDDYNDALEHEKSCQMKSTTSLKREEESVGNASPKKTIPLGLVHDISEDAEKKKRRNCPITFGIIDVQSGDLKIFKTKKSTKMSKVFNAYADLSGIEPASLRFVVDGVNICPDDTPKTLKLEKVDLIECFVQNTSIKKLDNDDTPPNVSNPQFIVLTDHLKERIYERGFNRFDFCEVILCGCRYQEGGNGHSRFTYKRVTAITDSDVEVGTASAFPREHLRRVEVPWKH